MKSSTLLGTCAGYLAARGMSIQWKLHEDTMASNVAKKQGVLLHLAAGRTIAEAAQHYGISTRQIDRWRADPAFRQREVELRSDLVSLALGRLSDAMKDAADTLVSLLKSTNDTVKLGACKAILENGNRLRESTEIEARLKSLEERAKEIGGKPA